uniref:DNA adenine methylase n=1 Tax=Agathobacter sp. TaxID=2021311 RepID=UPI004055D5AF
MFKPVIKWSGSKRSQSAKIKEYLPEKFNRYYEPFIGGGSMLLIVWKKLFRIGLNIFRVRSLLPQTILLQPKLPKRVI